MEINKDTINNEIVRPTVTRKIGIAILDIFLLFFTFLVLNSYIISPAFANRANYIQTIEAYTQRMVDSNLYVKTSEGIVEVINTYDTTTDEKEFYKNVDQHLINFYLNFANEGINIDLYNKSKEESNYFDLAIAMLSFSRFSSLGINKIFLKKISSH